VKAMILLIGRQEKSVWHQILSESLTTLGKLDLVSEEELSAETTQTDYNLVIVDAATVIDAENLLSRLLIEKPYLKIVVATLSPTWQEARAVLRAGAADYLSKALTRRELLVAIENVLNIR